MTSENMRSIRGARLRHSLQRPVPTRLEVSPPVGVRPVGGKGQGDLFDPSAGGPHGSKVMTRHPVRSIELRRQVVAEYAAGETLGERRPHAVCARRPIAAPPAELAGVPVAGSSPPLPAAAGAVRV